LTFSPGDIKGEYYHVDIGTAGSITLLLQTAVYPALFADYHSELEIRGGTDVNWSPSVDYVKQVFLPASGLLEFVNLDIRRRGYYPKGGGDVVVRIELGKPEPVVLLPGGRIKGIRGKIHFCELPEDVPERMAGGVKEALGKNVILEMENGHSRSPGCGVTLWTETDKGAFLGSVGLGEKGVRAEDIGENAGKALKEELDAGGSVDVHLADQLLLPLALFGGEFFCRELTGHARTNMDVIGKFLGDEVFTVNEENGLFRISSAGMKK
jgi:RNA 3'-phosphate cyclase